MPLTAPQVQLTPRHVSSTTLTVALSNVDSRMTVASGAIFDALPTAALLTDGVNSEVISVDAVFSGTTYNITRSIEPATAAAAFPANTTQVKLIVAAETIRRMQRAFRERTAGLVSVREFGAQGDALSATGTIASGQTTLNGSVFAAGAFPAGDVNTAISVQGAGPGGTDLVTTIASFSSSVVVTLAAPAGTTVAAALATWNGKVSRVAMGAGGATCTLIGPWTAADVGKPIVIQAAGGSSTLPLVTLITGWSSATQITLNSPALSLATNASATYGTDDTAAIRAALASIPTGRGGRVIVPAGTYMITGTLNIPSHCELWGTSAGNLPLLRGDLDYHAGTCLVWAGPTAVLPTVMPMIRLFDVQGVIVHGIVCNGENVPGVAGFLLDSDNGSGVQGAVSTQETVLEYFACWSCYVGIQWGHATDSSAAQNTQTDTVNLRRFWMAAPTIVASAVGIIVQSSNTQISRIEHGIFQNLLRGIHFQRHGGITTVDRCIGGSINYLGTGGGFIQTSHFCGEIVLSNCQAESCSYFLRALDRINDADTGGYPAVGVTLSPITMLCCHLDTPILVTGQQTILTIGCSNSAAVPGGFTYSTNPGTVISIGDVLQNAWVMSTGNLYKLCTIMGSGPISSGIPETILPRLTVGPPIGGANPTIQLRHLTVVQTIGSGGWTPSGNIGTGLTATATIGCTGAQPGDTCIATPDASALAGLTWNAYCNTLNAVTVRMTNAGGAQLPFPANWRVTVLGYA